MKKALAILAALALVGSAVFAEGPISFTVGTTVSAWGNEGFQWVGNKNTYQTDDNFIGVNYSTENAGITIDLRLKDVTNVKEVTSKAVDTLADVKSDAVKALSLHNYSAWIKPASFVKFSLGTNVAVSAIGAESIRWNCLGSRVGEETGVTMELTPIDGLYIGFLLKGMAAGSDGSFGKNPFIAGTYGAGISYAIAGIVTPAFQWRYADEDNAISGGLKLTAVQNLDLTVAGTMFIYDTDDAKDNLMKGELFGGYNAGAFSIKFLERAFIRGSKTASDLQFGNVVKVEANYNIVDGVSFNLKGFHMMNVTGYDHWDGGFNENSCTAKSNALRVWASLPIAMSKGVTVTPGFMIDKNLQDTAAQTVWSIPVCFMFNF